MKPNVNKYVPPFSTITVNENQTSMKLYRSFWQSVYTCFVAYRHIFLFSSPGGLDASIILGSLDRNKYSGKLMSYLEPVLLSSDRSVFLRCWHANTDGWAATTFHSNCDGKGPTVTIIKVNDYIFGGYTDVSWYSKY